MSRFQSNAMMLRVAAVAASVSMALGVAAVVQAAPSFTEKAIGDVGWQVEFVGSSYDSATDTTTFTYELTADLSEKDLSHWVLALDDSPIGSEGCGLVKFGLDPTTGVSGWKCDDGQNAGSVQTYRLTFSGQLGELATQYSVKGGTYYAVGGTTGPGDAVVGTLKYKLSGTAFMDINGNGMMEADEPVFANVLVSLSNGETSRTDDLGHYSFTDLTPGPYQLTVAPQTPAVMDDFNELLSRYFEQSAPALLDVGLASDTEGQDFGYRVNVAALMDEFDGSDPDGNGQSFTGSGKTIGFWKHQLTSALKGKTKGVQVSAAVVRDYLYSGTSSVKSMYLDVFADLPGSVPGAYSYGLDVLGKTSSNEVDLLKKQLMATELNYQAGWGLESIPLQGALIAWAEYLVLYHDDFSRDELLQAKDICDLINNSGD